MIISAGYRIGPFEVESALVAHPAVAEAAAVAAPDEVRGQVVRAVVVLQPGFEPGDVLAGELQEHVKAQTAPYKYPRIVDFAEALPKTPSGKIRRAAPARVASEAMPNHLADETSPVPPPAQGQPGRLVPVGRGGARARARRGPADPALDRLLRLPLVPRDGARVVRGPRDRAS